MVRGVNEVGAMLGQVAAAQAGRAAWLARRATIENTRAGLRAREVDAERLDAADADAAGNAAVPTAAVPRRAGPGPDAEQLRRLAEQVALPQVLLPPPSAGLPKQRQLAQLVARVDFLRAGAEAGVAPGEAGRAASAAKQAGPTDAPRAANPAPGALDAWLGRAFRSADLPRLRRLLSPSPQVDRALVALLRPAQDTPEVAGRVPGAGDALGGPPPSPGPGPVTTLRASQPSATPAQKPGTDPGRVSAALRFSLRGPRPAAKGPATASATRPRPISGAPAAYLNWTAFAALLSARQLQGLLEAALLRLRDVQKQNAAESLANAFAQTHVRAQIAHERLVAQHGWLGHVLDVLPDWRTARAGRLRNATKPLAGGSGNLLQADGFEAAQVRARLRALQGRAAAHDPQALLDAPEGAPALLDWVPAADGRPAERLARVVLEPDELAALDADAQRAWHADAARLEELEGCDLANVFGRLALSSAQLAQAAERCRRAAVAAETEPDQVPRARAAGLRRLADRYAARAQAHRERALTCGYREAALAVGRRQKLEFADSMGAEARRRAAASQGRRRVVQMLAEPQNDAAARAQLEARLGELDVELEDRNARLAGMHLAVQMTDTLRDAHARGRPRGGSLRAAWARLRPLGPRARAAAQLRAADHLDALLDPQNVELCRGGGLQGHLGRLGDEGAAWAEAYADPAFSRLDQWNRAYGPMYLRTTEPAIQTLARQAEGGLDEVAAYFPSDRDAFYAALERQQAQTVGLVQQLRSLLQVAS